MTDVDASAECLFGAIDTPSSRGEAGDLQPEGVRTNSPPLCSSGEKERTVFERYNVVSECDLVEAAKKLNALHTTVRLKPDTTYDGDGHNLAAVTRPSKSRQRMSL